jgi:hypothetical protein
MLEQVGRERACPGADVEAAPAPVLRLTREAADQDAVFPRPDALDARIGEPMKKLRISPREALDVGVKLAYGQT